MEINVYEDANGVKVQVCRGLGDNTWMAARVKGASRRRIKTERLPAGSSPFELQRCLDAYAKDHHWSVAESFKFPEDIMLYDGEPWATCPECKNSQPDMGNGVDCEQCGHWPMPTVGRLPWFD